MDVKQDNEQLRESSGTVTDESKLVCFIYLLGRDHLPLGQVEEILRSMDCTDDTGFVYTNGWLAQYAQNIAARLTE